MPASADTLNIDDFCRDVARAVVMLAAQFPRPLNLFVEDVYQSEETDEFGLHSDRFLACFSALLWLADEGLIRYTDTVRTECLEQAVLTSAALRALLVPTALDEANPSLSVDASTLLEQLRGALRARSSTDVRLHVLSLLAHARREPTD